MYTKIVGIKNGILFGLTLLDTILGEFRDPGGFVSFSYKNLYGFLPKSYKRKSFYTVTHSLREDRSITALSRGNFQLTKRGRELILESFPLLKFVNIAWDGKWRLVGFDIEENKRSLRNSLRRFLYRCGFGMLQESLYVSPLPIEDQVARFIGSNRELLLNTYIFISDKFFLEDRASFIEKLFKIEKVNEEYKTLLRRIEDGVEGQSELVRDFLQLSSRDPFLPQELLPKDFARSKVWVALREKGII